jgi:hypothetical protein
MKKTVLTFGVISGLIMSAMMLATLPLLHKIPSGKAMILGYTTMVLAGLLVFFGIRSYRENVSGGRITFARGFAVGILITLLACVFYVGTWEILYFNFLPNFAEKYATQMVENAKASGASQQKIDETSRQAEQFVQNYHNPVYNVGMTFIEVFPVFLVITLISAGILRRKTPVPVTT